MDISPTHDQLFRIVVWVISLFGIVTYFAYYMWSLIYHFLKPILKQLYDYLYITAVPARNYYPVGTVLTTSRNTGTTIGTTIFMLILSLDTRDDLNIENYLRTYSVLYYGLDSSPHAFEPTNPWRTQVSLFYSNDALSPLEFPWDDGYIQSCI